MTLTPAAATGRIKERRDLGSTAAVSCIESAGVEPDRSCDAWIVGLVTGNGITVAEFSDGLPSSRSYDQYHGLKPDADADPLLNSRGSRVCAAWAPPAEAVSGLAGADALPPGGASFESSSVDDSVGRFSLPIMRTLYQGRDHL